MTDADGVIDVIESALQDYAVSKDAMRWSPNIKPQTYADFLRQAVAQGEDSHSSVTLHFHCSLKSHENGQLCGRPAEQLKLARCPDHGLFTLWLCSFHAGVPSADAFCRVCCQPLSDPDAPPDSLDELLIEGLAIAGRTDDERAALRILYGTYLHQLIPARLRTLPQEEETAPSADLG